MSADPDVQLAALELLASRGAPVVFRIVGDSMLPTLQPGAAVCVVPAPPAARFGDLLLFRQADYLAVHRVLGHARHASRRSCYRTRGDGVLGFDPPVRPESVRGRVVAMSRREGWRSVEGPGARAYALLVGLHDLAFGAAGVLAARAGGRLRPVVAAIDRALLDALDALLFRALHRRVEAPDGVE